MLRSFGLFVLCSALTVASTTVTAQVDQKSTWGFAAARIDSRFSHSIYTGYGYRALFLIGGLVTNPRTGYTEQVLGTGARLRSKRSLGQLAALTFCNASDSRYAQLYYFPTLTLRRVSISAPFEAYLPLDSAGVRQFAMPGLAVLSHVGGQFAAGLVYELGAAERARTTQAGGVAFRLALPGAELGVDAFGGLSHRRSHVRLVFRAFY